MRLKLLSKLSLLAVGGGALAYAYGRPRRRPGRMQGLFDDATDEREVVDFVDPTARDTGPTTMPRTYANDPLDPVQSIDEVHEFHVEELGVDAMSTADGDDLLELSSLEAAYDAVLDIEQPEDTTLDEIEAAARDTGNLYGARTVAATDRAHPDGDASFDEGQNWLEALETDSVEMGPEVEVDLADIVDDGDVYRAPHAGDNKDTPVADRGSGGSAGI